MTGALVYPEPAGAGRVVFGEARKGAPASPEGAPSGADEGCSSSSAQERAEVDSSDSESEEPRQAQAVLFIDSGKLVTEQPDGRTEVVQLQVQRLRDDLDGLAEEVDDDDDGSSFLSPIPVMCPIQTQELRIVSDVHVVHSPPPAADPSTPGSAPSPLDKARRGSLMVGTSERRGSLSGSGLFRLSSGGSSFKLSSGGGSGSLTFLAPTGEDGGARSPMTAGSGASSPTGAHTVVQLSSLPPVLAPQFPLNSGSQNYGNGSLLYGAAGRDRRRSIVFPDEKGETLVNVVESADTHYQVDNRSICSICYDNTRAALFGAAAVLAVTLSLSVMR